MHETQLYLPKRCADDTIRVPRTPRTDVTWNILSDLPILQKVDEIMSTASIQSHHNTYLLTSRFYHLETSLQPRQSSKKAPVLENYISIRAHRTIEAL